MSQTFLTPDRLFDRPWHPGHTFGPRPSGGRRWTMLLIFVLLCSVIGAYLFITDSSRVRSMAQSELTRILGGPVTVTRAKLSIFEGLRLEGVKVSVDDSGADDSTLFQAKLFLLNYDPRLLLAGRLKVTQIVAIDPHVKLTENLDTGKWNYQRLVRQGPATNPRVNSTSVPLLPEILLRNAQIDYSEIKDGVQKPMGTMNIEGQLAPSSNGDVYTFELQSRGGGSDGRALALGPSVTGMLVRPTGVVTAKLNDFVFGPGVESMLPKQVRSWWQRHGLAGGVNIPVFSYIPGPGGSGDARFTVQTVLTDVNLTVQPQEWMSREEIQIQSWTAQAFDAMHDAGLNAQFVERLAKLVEPSPIQLQHVTGVFEFTEGGILLKNVHGSLESNSFAIDGNIFGYSPLSPVSITVASDNTSIPSKPRYITSMPRQVRELYDHLRPQGTCALSVKLDRPSLGARLEVAGEVNILDGNFIFDKFPYPVRGATGKIVFGPDPASGGADAVRLMSLRGHGVADGPNRDSIIKLDGFIGPFTADPYIEVIVSSNRVSNEPTLTAAFPSEVKQALRNLDADGKGEFPTYHGGFTCKIVREVGSSSHWIIDTDITLDDAAGKMVAFPYPMDHVTGKLAIREGYIDILDATMKRGDASLVIGGRVTWRAGAGGTPLEPGDVMDKVTPARPDLKVTARNVPIDKNLLDALPEDRRNWLEKVGLRGTLDIDGRVWRKHAGENVATQSGDSDLTHDFQLHLRDASVWPTEGTFALAGIDGKLRLTPDRLVITDMSGKRGEGDLAGRGVVSWPNNRPHISLDGSAKKLTLDRTLYQILPAAGKKAWDAVQPKGVVDMELAYSGEVGVVSPPSAAAPRLSPSPGTPGEGRGEGRGVATTTRADSPTKLSTNSTLHPHPNPLPQGRGENAFSLTIHPRTLSATVQAVPYRLDDITGIVSVEDGKVTLKGLTARHGDGTIKLAGVGSAGDAIDWDLKIAAKNVTLDEEFRKAMPAALASILESLKIVGGVDFELPRLTVKQSPADRPRPATLPTTLATTGPSTTPLDIDFATKIDLAGGSMDVGVPMTGMKGSIALDGTVRDSKLDTLSGPVDFASLKIANRAASDVHAEFFKPAGYDALRIGQLRGELAGGEMAGQIDLAFPDVGASRYAMNLVLHNADVRELTADAEPDLSGELTASLALEGSWSDVKTRRGRGDVSVGGKEMYKIPLLLGLLQITNLSLPITSPFNEGTARYSVDGQVVTFESLALRSKSMLMSGSGQLDFGTKKVKMTFTTDNPNWPRIPIVGDVLQTAKHEMLQIHVKGTLQEPKVSATAINTFTTSVDEVLRGDEKR